jgi:dynein heavy chain, axonemal
MYLENIFMADDIRLQLPEEAKRFERVDKTFKKIMTETAKNTLVLEACQMDRLELLKSLAVQLETCQKSLSEYLLTKRNAFPRFFFISDDELLSIIGSQDPTNVQEHMIKLFDNVIALKFGSSRNTRNVVGMTSSQVRQSVMTSRLPSGYLVIYQVVPKCTFCCGCAAIAFIHAALPHKNRRIKTKMHLYTTILSQ